MTVSFWQDRSSEASHEAEILVIGAGISGASAAYWLAERGVEVAVIDASEAASGASGRSGGMLLLGTADPYSRVVDLFGRERAREVWAFSQENRALLEERIIGDGAFDPHLRVVRSGTTSASVSPHEQDELARSTELLLEDGFTYELLDRAAMSDAVGRDGFHGGLVDPNGMTLDPARLTRRVLDLAVERGARFYPHHALMRVEDGSDGVTVTTTHARFHAQMVLLCTNAYSPLVHSHFEDRVYPARGQMLATEPVVRRIAPWGIYADFGYEYLWQLPTGEIVAGGWRQHAKDAEKGYSDETTDVIQEGIWGFLQQYFPGLEHVRITHRWAGVMGFSGDGLPFVGELPSRPRVKYLAGHTGHGLGFAFLSAKKLVAMALDGDSPGWLGAGRLRAKR